jgi:DNA-binding transcriptional LysR family regulator
MATILSRWLAPMRETHPKLRVEVTGATHQVDLRRREADLALRMAQPTQPDLVARPAVTLGWALYASVEYLARRGAPRALDDFGGHELVLYTSPMSAIAGAAWLEQHQGGGAAAVRVENTASAILAMVDGLGIGCIPCYLAADQPTLRRVFPEVVAENRGWVVCHEDERETPRIRAVADEILAVFDRERVLLSGA